MDNEINEVIENIEPQEEIQDIEEPIQSAEEVVTQEDIIIPENWESPLKDVFNDFDSKKSLLDSIQDESVKGQLGDFFNNGKRAVFDKLKNLDSGYQGKFQELSEQRKAFEGERTSFEDNRNLVQTYKALEETSRNIDGDLFNRETSRLGGTNQYYSSLHQVNSMMEKDPLNTINNICQAYGVTPQMLAEGANSPEYQQRQAQQTQQQSVVDLEQRMLAKVEEQFNSRKAQELLDNFVNAKDEAGESKHRYFNQVEGVMGQLNQAYPNKSIEELYSMACDLHSKADESFNREYTQATVNKQAQELVKKQEVEKAKRVVGVKPDITKSSVKKNLSWEQELEASLDKQEY